MTSDVFASIRTTIRDFSDAVRWACLLEATAPKPGNVFPGADFEDLKFEHFVRAADLSAMTLTDERSGLGQRVLRTVETCVEHTQTNVNLGIALLLAPLVVAAQSLKSTAGQVSLTSWRQSLALTLRSLDAKESRLVFAAIATANAGGLSIPDDDLASLEMDVMDPQSELGDLMEAMRRAQDRDQIALEYASDFAGIFDEVLPTLRDQIAISGDTLRGIRRASVVLLSQNPDSLIVRKCGAEEAARIQQLARGVQLDDETSIDRLDQALRSDGHRRNPGTTADRIAAGLLVMLCCSAHEVDTYHP